MICQFTLIFNVIFTKDLPSAICKKVMIPPLQLVSTANSIKNLLAWLQAQMVRVVQAKATTSIL